MLQLWSQQSEDQPNGTFCFSFGWKMLCFAETYTSVTKIKNVLTRAFINLRLFISPPPTPPQNKSMLTTHLSTNYRRYILARQTVAWMNWAADIYHVSHSVAHERRGWGKREGHGRITKEQKEEENFDKTRKVPQCVQVFPREYSRQAQALCLGKWRPAC